MLNYKYYAKQVGTSIQHFTGKKGIGERKTINFQNKIFWEIKKTFRRPHVKSNQKT